MEYTTNKMEQKNKNIDNFKKFKLFLKSFKSKFNKNTKQVKEMKINSQNPSHPPPTPYSRSGTSHSSFLTKSVIIKPLKQASSQNGYESEYEEMTSDYCTLPRKKMKYRIKQSVFEKSLDVIILEARREIIEESSSDESEDTYVACNEENIYEDLNFNNVNILEQEEDIYEEIKI